MEDRERLLNEREKVIEAMRRKIFGLRGIADLMVHINGIVEEVTETICDHYCKYPDEYGMEGFDDMIAEKCEDCPLGRL